MLSVNNAAKLPPHLGLRLLLVALLVGVVADLLLRATPWGVNLLVTVGVGVVAGGLLCRWGDVKLEGEGRWLVAPLAGQPIARPPQAQSTVERYTPEAYSRSREVCV